MSQVTTRTSSPAPSASGAAPAVQRRSALRGSDFATQLKTLTPVQRHGEGESTAQVHEAAARGVAGSGGSLPHMDAIQRSFGGHDVSAVQAHVGGAASEASAAMGAEAYATGNDVAFGAAPSLHTAAHEAAHVVQQRAGVSLSGGVGSVGDSYEQHADSVADAVVQGKSAEPILDKMAGGPSVQKRAIQRRAVQRSPGGPAPVTDTGSIGGTTGSVTVTPGLQATNPPEQFTGSVAKYDTNFATVKANITARGGSPAQVTNFEAKKATWYHRWGVAALQNDADSAAAQGEFTAIRADLVTIFPDDSASEGGGHLYTGYAGGGSGRKRAEATMAGENADADNQAAGITHRTLETTLVGNLFDGVANSPRDEAEKPKWIPYWGSQASQWWSHISAEYAKTFTGAVHGHIDVGFPYYVSEQVIKPNPGKTRSDLSGQLDAVIKLHPSVFRDDELPRIATLMADGAVTSFQAHLRIETAPNVVKSVVVDIPPAGIADGAALIAKIDQAIKANCSAAELEPNLPPDPAPATDTSASGGPTT